MGTTVPGCVLGRRDEGGVSVDFSKPQDDCQAHLDPWPLHRLGVAGDDAALRADRSATHSAVTLRPMMLPPTQTATAQFSRSPADGCVEPARNRRAATLNRRTSGCSDHTPPGAPVPPGESPRVQSVSWTLLDGIWAGRITPASQAGAPRLNSTFNRSGRGGT